MKSWYVVLLVWLLFPSGASSGSDASRPVPKTQVARSRGSHGGLLVTLKDLRVEVVVWQTEIQLWVDDAEGRPLDPKETEVSLVVTPPGGAKRTIVAHPRGESWACAHDLGEGRALRILVRVKHRGPEQEGSLDWRIEDERGRSNDEPF